MMACRTLEEPIAAAAPLSSAVPAIFLKYGDFKWDKILPDLGADSPEICILHTDPTTHATQLMIRTPRAIHVRKHWHSANETHTMIAGTATFACDGKRMELGPGSLTLCRPGWCTKHGSRRDQLRLSP